jgi:tetratricopeptide (TPR) repeat protein
MAPEQFDDAKHVDVRADIYSFGVMLFQMITGRLPFRGGTWEEYERLHKTQLLPEFKTQSLELKAIVQTCLAKDPEQRFADFSQVREQMADVYKRLTGETAPQPVVGEELNAAQWMNKGASLSNLGRSEEALACYDRALAINPQDAEAWSNKGNALGALGRSEEALACYDRALAINPQLAQAWSNKGVVLANDFQLYREALACFEEAQRLGLPQAAQAIALCRQMLGQQR